MSWLSSKKNEIDAIEEEPQHPVDVQVIEDVINLINTASKMKCIFQLNLKLTIGEFKIDNDSFKDIKLSNKTKKEDNRLVIAYKDALLSNQTSIEVENIIGVNFILNYTDKGNDINV